MERVVERTTIAVDESVPWQTTLRQYAESLRATILRHPAILPLALTRPLTTAQSLRTVERGLQVLNDAGFPLGRALDVINSLTIFVVGHTAAEVGATGTNERSGPGSAASLAQLDPVQFPLISEAARSGQGTDDEHRFHFGVQALLSGFAATQLQA